MKQPVRDERWTDRKGEAWQVEVAAMVKPTIGAPRRLAFIRFRHVSGVTAKVMPQDLDTWRREATDPFEGRRREIGDAIRHGAKVIVFPAVGACPVRKGEIYHLPCDKILIDRFARKLVKGRPAEWHVEFIRLVKDRDYFLRSIVPAATRTELVKPVTPDVQKAARIDGNYTHAREPDGDELPAVHPDWKDRGVAAREAIRQDAQAEEARRRRESDARARLGRILKGLDQQQSIAMLARIERLCDEAEDDSLKSAA